MSQEVLHIYKRSWKTTMQPMQKFLLITTYEGMAK